MSSLKPVSTVETGAPSTLDKALLQLHGDDNILVCIKRIPALTWVLIDGQPVQLAQELPVGHKIARVSLAVGAKVVRYGAAIGSMTHAAQVGEHVHMHNMQSDYLPSHTRSQQIQTPMAE
jgi:(2R)-sulfolactate sulfo-lyase subunit alpha